MNGDEQQAPPDVGRAERLRSDFEHGLGGSAVCLGRRRRARRAVSGRGVGAATSASERGRRSARRPLGSRVGASAARLGGLRRGRRRPESLVGRGLGGRLALASAASAASSAPVDGSPSARPSAIAGVSSAPVAVPPAAWIFSIALLLNASATTNSGAPTSPWPRILSGFASVLTRPAARRISWLTVIGAVRPLRLVAPGMSPAASSPSSTSRLIAPRFTTS